MEKSRFAVVDVETTGLDPKVERVVEIAVVLVDEQWVVDSWSSLVNPEMPIPARASQIHGIYDEDVAQAPTMEALVAEILTRCQGRVVAAHNARFDLSFLPFLASHDALCTMQLARRAFPGAPNHQNQTLRKYLGLDRDPRIAMLDAHRALADAMVSAHILIRALRKEESESA
ncbi:MAG: 3'-5' exonuclease [Vulcanimicrobiaceae bacterium]